MNILKKNSNRNYTLYTSFLLRVDHPNEKNISDHNSFWGLQENWQGLISQCVLAQKGNKPTLNVNALASQKRTCAFKSHTL